MNLEDQIRASARGQSNRYRPGDDLLPRIEHRRRQRAARRITASAVAAVVLFGGGALALTTLRDRDATTNVANSTELTVAETAADTVAPTTAAPSTTIAAADPTSAAATTTAAPEETAPAVNVPEYTPLTDANVPMPTLAPGGATGLSDFWNVPQLGREAVRGSGCGSSGQIGDTIPDGLWAGFIVDDGSDGTVAIDLLCIYMPDAGPGVLANPTATTINADPNYLIVNNNTRARAMPLDQGIVLRLAARDGNDRCVDARSTTQWADIPADRQTWIRIHGGRVTWILADCPPQ